MSRSDISEDSRVQSEQVVSHNPLREFTPAVVLGPMEDDGEDELGWRAGARKRNCHFRFPTITAILSEGCTPEGKTDR